MNDVAVLARQTAELLERQGWVQHTRVDPDGRVCVSEALTRAYKETLFQKDVLFDTWIGFGLHVCTPSSLAVWNDAPGRTATQVTQALREFAEKVEAG